MRPRYRSSDWGFIGKSKKELDGTYTMVLLCTSVLWKPASSAQRSCFWWRRFPSPTGRKGWHLIKHRFFMPLVHGHQVGSLTPTFLFAWSGPYYVTSQGRSAALLPFSMATIPTPGFVCARCSSAAAILLSSLTLVWMNRKVLGRPAKEVSSWMEELVIVTAELILAPTFHRRLNVLKMKSSVPQQFFLLFLWWLKASFPWMQRTQWS